MAGCATLSGDTHQLTKYLDLHSVSGHERSDLITSVTGALLVPSIECSLRNLFGSGSLPPRTLVLLPGLDGTGNLFAKFVSTVTPNLDARIVRYPTDRPLSYADLLSTVVDTIPREEPFVLLAESFSTPLAVTIPEHEK